MPKVKLPGAMRSPYKTFLANVFQIQEERLGQPDEPDKLQDIMLGNRAPAGDVAVARFELFECFAVHITPFFFRRSMASALMSSHEDSTCSECSPSKGGGNRTDAGVAENFTGNPAMRTVPAVGCATSTSMSR